MGCWRDERSPPSVKVCVLTCHGHAVDIFRSYTHPCISNAVLIGHSYALCRCVSYTHLFEGSLIRS